MTQGEIEKVLSKIDVPLEGPGFHSAVFEFLCRKEKKEKPSDPIDYIIWEEFFYLSKHLDDSEIQESCSVRNVLKTRMLSEFLIDEEGALKVDEIPQVIEKLKAHLFSLGPDRQYDALRNQQIIDMLMALKNDKSLARKLNLIRKPDRHRYAEEVIRETLQLPDKTVIKDKHARQAALSALLCYLRQNVGSCFATAPAIVVQTEQPSTFLKDIQELLATGRLKRTFGGVEYAVPFSFSWGAGELRRVLLFQRDRDQENLNLWRSPGLIMALERVGLIDENLGLKEKESFCKKLIDKTLKGWKGKGSWFYTSIENLLRRILLVHLDLTEEMVKEYERRPKGMIHGGVLVMEPQQSTKGRGGVGKRCAKFLQMFQQAKSSFKVLSNNALLKTWEFTIASFSETKLQFTTWNLYTSLGLKPEDQGGIGPHLYEILKRRLDECNEKVQDLQFEYEQSFNYLQNLQRRIRRASTEDEARWLRVDYQARAADFQSIEEVRNTFHDKARRYANLYNGLIDLYFKLFSNYFQEVYDPDILDVSIGPFDDSPAGFRLLYKHGRSNTSQWTPINNHSDFIDALASFFMATETELVNAKEMEGLEEDITEITTAIVSHVRSKEFIETAFWRMAKEHRSPLIKDPLDNLDKIEKKPWVYTSGGALTTLVSCYFCLDEKPKEESQWVDNPLELLVFLIDSVKGIPAYTLDEFIKSPEKRLLMHSPTHAFLLKPGYPHFIKGWKNSSFTYTWVRDNIVRPMEGFIDKIYLDDEKMSFLTDSLSKLMPKEMQHFFKDSVGHLGGSMKANDYRQHVLDLVELSRGLQVAGRSALDADQVDATLYSLLPLFPSYQLKEKVKTILSQLPEIEKSKQERLIEALDKFSGKAGSPRTISAKGLQDIVKGLLILLNMQTSVAHDYPLLISQIAQKEGYAMPKPFIFADTNWVKDFFAFLVNPGSGKLELWRVDYTGSIGAPMSDWKQWLDGTKKHPDWGVYIRPHEYNFLDINKKIY